MGIHRRLFAPLPLLWAAACKTPGDSALAGRPPLGDLRDGTVKTLIYQGLERVVAQRAKSAMAGAELGDVEAFRFTVIKLTHGFEDVTAEATADADGMDVEVTGWYKRNPEQGATPTCASFDSLVRVARTPQGWTLPAQPQLSRVDQEDCY